MIATTRWQLATLLVGLTLFAVVVAAAYRLEVAAQIGYAAVCRRRCSRSPAA